MKFKIYIIAGILILAVGSIFLLRYYTAPKSFDFEDMTIKGWANIQVTDLDSNACMLLPETEKMSGFAADIKSKKFKKQKMFSLSGKKQYLVEFTAGSEPLDSLTIVNEHMVLYKGIPYQSDARISLEYLKTLFCVYQNERYSTRLDAYAFFINDIPIYIGDWEILPIFPAKAETYRTKDTRLGKEVTVYHYDSFEYRTLEFDCNEAPYSLICYMSSKSDDIELLWGSHKIKVGDSRQQLKDSLYGDSLQLISKEALNEFNIDDDFETAYLYAPDDGTAYCVLFLFTGDRISKIIITDR